MSARASRGGRPAISVGSVLVAPVVVGCEEGEEGRRARRSSMCESREGRKPARSSCDRSVE